MSNLNNNKLEIFIFVKIKIMLFTKGLNIYFKNIIK